MKFIDKKLIKCLILNNLLIVRSFHSSYTPKLYLSIKNIKKCYLTNNIYHDIYSDLCENNSINNSINNINNNINYNYLTAEHIFPQSFMKHYKSAKNDMHNIYLTSAYNNFHRSNYKFVEFDIDNNANFIKINENNYKSILQHEFIPCFNIKGIIARTIAYQKYIYPKLKTEFVLDENLIVKWNNLYPPNQLEIKRNNIIRNIQGNFNPYISEYKIL